MALYMSKSEIVSSYQRAADPKEQVKILAQLNACEKSEIIDVLTEAGVYVGKSPSEKKVRHRAGAEYDHLTSKEKRQQKSHHHRRTPEEQDATYGPLYKAGFNDTKMAAEAGVSLGAITSWRRRRGLPPNRKPGWQGAPNRGKEAEDNELQPEAGREADQ